MGTSIQMIITRLHSRAHPSFIPAHNVCIFGMETPLRGRSGGHTGTAPTKLHHAFLHHSIKRHHPSTCNPPIINGQHRPRSCNAIHHLEMNERQNKTIYHRVPTNSRIKLVSTPNINVGWFSYIAHNCRLYLRTADNELAVYSRLTDLCKCIPHLCFKSSAHLVIMWSYSLSRSRDKSFLKPLYELD